MRRLTVWLLAVALSSFFLMYSSAANAADKKEAKKEKIATVNGKDIPKAEFDKEAGRIDQQMGAMGQTPDEGQKAAMKKKILDDLVERELLFQESQRLGVKVTDAEVDEQVGTLKKRFPTEAEFTATLEKMNYSEADLKAKFTQAITIRKMIDQEIAGKVTISADESKAFYDSHPDLFKMPEQVRASHILVKVDEKATDADKAKAREKITGIQKRLQKGEDFAAVAKEVSDCPSAANGGDLDYFQRGQMVGPFEDAAFALKPGEMSGIVETQFGFHIIKLTDKKEPGSAGYDEMKDRIEQHLKQEKVNQQIAQYVEQLKSKAKIETFAK